MLYQANTHQQTTTNYSTPAKMVIIGNKMVHPEVLKEQFLCNLDACKGACCWKGDYGAPLSDEEIETLQRIYADVAPFLTDEGRAMIEKEGVFTYFKGMRGNGTSLLPDGRCTFMTRDENGVAQCGIEQAHKAGATDFYKPISCHLYPIRVEENHANGFETLEYDRWDICSAACTLGAKQQLPVYRFLRDALVRKYGEAFYEEIEAAAAYVAGRG